MSDKKFVMATHLDHMIPTKERTKLVKEVVELLKPFKKEFDTIAFRGMSGALVAPMIASALNKELLMVRKEEDDSHSHLRVEGNYHAEKYIIIDDFICTGNTVANIILEIKNAVPKAQFLGTLEIGWGQARRKKKEKHLDKILNLSDFQYKQDEIVKKQCESENGESIPETR